MRSGWNAKGPWETLDVVTARVLETQYASDNSEATAVQSDGETTYYYDLLEWEEQRPEEDYGRPLRRVPWSERFNEAWSNLGEEHAMGGFCVPPPAQPPALPLPPPPPPAGGDAMSDDEEVQWQYRGGKQGNGKWRWSDDSRWLEAAYQNRESQPVVRRTYHEETYEYNFRTMMQRNVTNTSAPRRRIRRWMASLNLDSD